jgi:two-component system sensor histidine kinase/response regulator
MMTRNEQRKLMLEMFYLKPGLDIPEESEVADVSKVAFLNEFKALQRSTQRLQDQLATLKARNEELESYAHTVAHNLKTPLSVIILTSDAITEIGDLKPQEIKEFMQQIRSTAYEMDNTIDNLLLFSEVRKVDVLTEPMDMEMVVKNVLKRLNHMVHEYQCTIVKPKSWPRAIGYAPWIEEVWANYLSNAIKYGGRPPFVRLGATPQADGMISFWISDNGAGVPAEMQMHLFAPYSQVSQIHKSGHGLGLSIVRHIVEKLGGKVGIENKNGRGSIFFFTLPACHDTAGSV